MIPKEKNTLLVVDDDNINLMTLSNILKDEYNVLIAPDGESAVRIAGNELPDLILLDILMPGIDGYQVFRTLQNSDSTAHIPIIFITGLNNKDDEKKGLMLGAADYISKPFDDMIIKLRVHHQIKIVNQLRTIEHLSMIDQLTGIANRRNFDTRLRSEWGTAVREKFPLSLLLIDVDYFKKYNDTYGHQQGDIALQKMAQVLSDTLKRPADFAARWGGEEFVAVLPNTDLSGGLKIGEEIRKNVEAAEIPLDEGAAGGKENEPGTITGITASIGISSQRPTMNCSVDDFISQADKALYEAKRTGRNRVVFYERQ